jgi:hypothetical protein
MRNSRENERQMTEKSRRYHLCLKAKRHLAAKRKPISPCGNRTPTGLSLIALLWLIRTRWCSRSFQCSVTHCVWSENRDPGRRVNGGRVSGLWQVSSVHTLSLYCLCRVEIVDVYVCSLTAEERIYRFAPNLA